jgi:hypothetical protein
LRLRSIWDYPASRACRRSCRPRAPTVNFTSIYTAHCITFILVSFWPCYYDDEHNKLQNSIQPLIHVPLMYHTVFVFFIKEPFERLKLHHIPNAKNKAPDILWGSLLRTWFKL